jgi:hypothetical protein
MKQIGLFFLALLFFTNNLIAAEKVTISGKIRSAESGEDLIRASIYVPELKTGTYSNTYGFYSITLPEGTYELKISYVGYESNIKKVKIYDDKTINFELEAQKTAADTIQVTAERRDVNLTETNTGIEKVSMKQIERVPVLLGEKDVMKTIQLLPGISTTSEGSTGFSVRGGSTDQNLVLLDEATVYSPSHLMGFVSVFNSDAIKDVTVYKGGIPAQFGGRASSVMDIQMNNGNKKHFATSGGIGILASRLTVEAPIVKDKLSFIASGRRSYMDWIAKAVPSTNVNSDTKFYYYDLNTKLNYEINENNRLFFSGYFGEDVFGFNTIGMDWGNTTFTTRWNHLFSKKLFSNTTLLYSKYSYGFNFNANIEMKSGIDDLSFKEDFTYFMNPNNTIKFGLSFMQHDFNPGQVFGRNDFNFEVIMPKQKSFESGLYISNEHKLTENFTMNYGVRFSLYNQLGNDSQVYEYDHNKNQDSNEPIDSTYYKEYEMVESFWDLEPRISMNYRLNETTSLKLSYNRMAQYLHQLQNSTSGQPTDYWMSSSNNIAPLRVNQISAGIFKNFFDNELETSIEVYYKDMGNITDFENGADVLMNKNVEAEVIQGDGRSYGAEFYLKKRFGLLTGWISYTLSRTEQKLDGINFNKWYPAKQDKTHDISVVASYQITDRISASTSFVYYTGNAVTFPAGKYIIHGQSIPYYTERNGYRMPDYHRLDLGLQIKGKKRDRFESTWDFSIYNVYNQKNAYTIYFQDKEDNPGVTEAVKVSLFGIIPSISYNFKF